VYFSKNEKRNARAEKKRTFLKMSFFDYIGSEIFKKTRSLEDAVNTEKVIIV
jgi:hypothetical protein